MKSNRADEAVSDIVGTVLLLGMTIALFSTLCVGVLSYPSNPSLPAANLVGTIEGKFLILEHRGGESLSLDTKIIITFGDGSSTSFIVRDESYLNDNAKKDNKWGIGEGLVYPLVYPDDSGKQIKIAVVDIESNSVIMLGSLQGI